MELTYTKVGDYYVPDLTLDDDADCEIGVYGRMNNIRDRAEEIVLHELVYA